MLHKIRGTLQEPIISNSGIRILQLWHILPSRRNGLDRRIQFAVVVIWQIRFPQDDMALRGTLWPLAEHRLGIYSCAWRDGGSKERNDRFSYHVLNFSFHSRVSSTFTWRLSEDCGSCVNMNGESRFDCPSASKRR
jgi:hypothetical protein